MNGLLKVFVDGNFVSSDNFFNSNTHRIIHHTLILNCLCQCGYCQYKQSFCWQECNYLKNIRRNSTFRAKGLCWELVEGDEWPSIKTLSFSLYLSNSCIPAMIFRIFSSLKNLSRKLIVLLLFLFLGVN
jgi:hypothetical protein